MTAPVEPPPTNIDAAAPAAVLRLVTATGVASVVAQLLLIREYITQFQGNEFIIALILCLWLIIGAAGSLVSTAAIKRGLSDSPVVLAAVSLMMAGMPAVMLVGIRLLRLQWFTLGVSVGFYPTAAFVAATLLPYAAGIGFILPYSLFVIRRHRPDMPGAGIYLRDALGGALGGALFAFCLVFWLSPVQASVVSALPMAAAAWAILPARRWWRPLPVAGLTLTAAGMMLGLTLETRSLALPFTPSVRTVESRYGRLQVVVDRGQTTIFQDGRPVAVSQDPAGAEAAVHLALCQREQVRRLLVIGAVGGMMREIAKYRPEAVDYLELDPAVTQLQFDSGLIAPIIGLNSVNSDARRYLRQAARSYDAIIVNLPDPDTFQINRFFTREFMTLAHRHLSADGVLSISISGYANYIPAPLKLMVASLRRTVAIAFSNVVLIPGERITLLASDAALTTDVPRRLAALGIETRYLSGAYAWEVTEDRLSQLETAARAPAPENADTTPYLMRLAFQQWFLRTGSHPVWLYGAIALVCALILWRARPLETVLFSTGFVSMGLEMLVIFAFQVFYGYVYFQLGAIITAFLAGLVPGAWLGNRRQHRLRKALILSDGALIGLVGSFAAALHLAGGWIPPAGYLVFGFTAAVVCGFQFPLILKSMGDDARAAGRAFAADLAGAGTGTLATSVVLLPMTGLYGVAAALVAVKVFSLLRLLAAKVNSV
ncbi:MAG: hypothetical protein ABIL58_04435 [Pseudomonadota bacterium]